jgi:hypothetical protein
MIPDVDFTIMDSRAHVAAADINILVVQNTYMSFRKALNCQYDFLVACITKANALTVEDVKGVLDCHGKMATISWDEQAARTLDAGLVSRFLTRDDFKELVKNIDQLIKEGASF